MKKYASTRIEGNGTVRTVFRTMALWAYLSEERAKLQLVKVIERKTKNQDLLSYNMPSIDEKRKFNGLPTKWRYLTSSKPSVGDR